MRKSNSSERDPAGEERRTTYQMRLADAAPDTLIFIDERAIYFRSGFEQPQDIQLATGHFETRLKEKAQDCPTCRVLHNLLSGCRAYRFHDTSPQASIRSHHHNEDDHYLRHDAGNLGPCLYALERTRPYFYRRAVETVRQVFPAFGNFRLAPGAANSRCALLNWHERDQSDRLFGPRQLSDGSLRFMTLATLFLQPPEKLPNVTVLDEPELGLHPCAVNVLAAMAKAAAASVQVVLATQSPRLADAFEPRQVVVLETEDSAGTRCRWLSPNGPAQWLEEHSLGELWEKNHFGGLP